MKPYRSRFGLMVVAWLALSLNSGCKKDKAAADEETDEGTPTGSSGRSDTLTTNIGSAVAIEIVIAPTSAKWDQIVVLDDQTLVLAGRAHNKAVAIKTTNGGKSWSGLSQTVTGWSAWGFGSNGATVLLSGKVKKGTVRGANATIGDISISFATSGASALRGPLSLPVVKPLWVERLTRPTVVSADAASVLLKRPKQQVLTSGSPGVLSKTLPNRDWIAAPYGVPPQLVNVHAGQIKVRPWPEAGKLPVVATSVPKFRAGAATTQALASAPRCSYGGITFQPVVDASRRPHAVGISEQRLLAIKLPIKRGTVFGCGPGGVVVDTFDAAARKLSLIRCGRTGACATPKNSPFDLWPEAHDRTVWAVTTTRGVVSVLEATGGNRWGLYLGHSSDEGKTFELAREIATGDGPNRFRMGTLVALGKRVLMFFTADTPDPSNSQRSWYVMASDNAGETWAAP